MTGRTTKILATAVLAGSLIATGAQARGGGGGGGGYAASAAAQDYPYCLQGQQWGYPGNCEFTSYPQCQATASGTNSYCGLNPRFAYGLQPQRHPHQGS
jgi:Protein of unknown function (DUF3551)